MALSLDILYPYQQNRCFSQNQGRRFFFMTGGRDEMQGFLQYLLVHLMVIMREGVATEREGFFLV